MIFHHLPFPSTPFAHLGAGKFTFACSDVYEGEWRENRYHGKGKYTSAASDE